LDATLSAVAVLIANHTTPSLRGRKLAIAGIILSVAVFASSFTVRYLFEQLAKKIRETVDRTEKSLTRNEQVPTTRP
jgi:hypothetical protein